jgi:segregation and condensation protein B
MAVDAQNKYVVEALIMAADRPLAVDDLAKVFSANNNSIEINELKEVLNELQQDYVGRSIELKEVASGYRFQINSKYSSWIAKLREERVLRYSSALLETLSLIAYRQPITRAEIEAVRGVTVSTNIIRTLLDHEWVRVVGYKDVPGKPALYATTKKFLDYFNLQGLDELPKLMEFTESVGENGEDSIPVAGKEAADEVQDN